MGPTTFLLLLFSQLFQRIRNCFFIPILNHCEKKIFGSYEHILQSLKPIACETAQKMKNDFCNGILNSILHPSKGPDSSLAQKISKLLNLLPTRKPNSQWRHPVLSPYDSSKAGSIHPSCVLFYPRKTNSKKRSSCLIWLQFLLIAKQNILGMIPTPGNNKKFYHGPIKTLVKRPGG